MTVGVSYDVALKYQGLMGNEHVTEVWVDGRAAGEVYVRTGTAVHCALVRGFALREDGTVREVLEDRAGNRTVAQLKADAVEAIVLFWHDHRALTTHKLDRAVIRS